MSDLPQLAYYCGRPIEDLTREELVDALNYSARELRAALDRASAERKVWSGMLSARRVAA